MNGRNTERTAAAAEALAAEEGVTGTPCGMMWAFQVPFSFVSHCFIAGEFIPVAGDISTAEGATAFIAAVEAVGDLEILINNMGIFETRDFAKVVGVVAGMLPFLRADTWRALLQASDEVWEKYLQANLMSVVRMSRYFLPKLLEANNNGRIINIASEAGYRPIPDMIVYSTTKSAVIGLSRGMAELTKGKRVTVNRLVQVGVLSVEVSSLSAAHLARLLPVCWSDQR